MIHSREFMKKKIQDNFGEIRGMMMIALKFDRLAFITLIINLNFTVV